MTSLTQDDIDALEEAIASGARRVKFKDREVEYRSLAEMKEILADAKSAVSGVRRKRRVIPEYDSGL